MSDYIFIGGSKFSSREIAGHIEMLNKEIYSVKTENQELKEKIKALTDEMESDNEIFRVCVNDKKISIIMDKNNLKNLDEFSAVRISNMIKTKLRRAFLTSYLDITGDE